jgi:hypothetical protein
MRGHTGPGQIISIEDLRRARTVTPRNDVLTDDAGAKLARPKTRGDCEDGCRPCPWISCKYNLYIDIDRSGGLRINFPELAPNEMTESCALDLADRGAITLEEVGAVMNFTRERARQLETAGLRGIKAVSFRRSIDFEDPPEDTRSPLAAIIRG